MVPKIIYKPLLEFHHMSGLVAYLYSICRKLILLN